MLKLGVLLLYPVVSLSITVLSFCPFDTQCTSLLSSFTLFLHLFFCGFFFLLSCKLWPAGDEISAFCLLQTVGDINKC